MLSVFEDGQITHIGKSLEADEDFLGLGRVQSIK
jgi:hypothetical protein